MAPAIQIDEPPALARSDRMEHKRMEHKRWKSNPEKTTKNMAPWCYEYRVDGDGRILGLAEYRGDVDHAHYSTRRDPRTIAQHHSAKTSRDETYARIPVDSRTSHSSHGSQASQLLPPPSPRRGDALKRALTLHGLKRRASSEVKKTPPASPYSPRPEIEKLAASFGPKGPKHITSPLPALPDPTPQGMFEMPRAAPRPPSRETPRPSPRPEISPTLSSHFELSPALSSSSASKNTQISSHDFALRPRLPPTPPRSPMVDEFPMPPRHELVKPMVQMSHVQPVYAPPRSPKGEARVAEQLEKAKMDMAKVVKRPPPLRRKGSKFIDQIERTEKLSPRAYQEREEIPPVPPMVLPAKEFNLPIQGALVASPLPAGMIFSNGRMSHQGAQRLNSIYSPNHSHNTPPTISITHVESPVAPPVETMAHPTLQRSASITRPLPLLPSSGRSLGRSNTTASRPPPKMSDVCMAEVKPVLTSGIIAQGHARMISC